jgi:hypothetical protein
MKHRAILLIGVLFGITLVSHVARADFQPPPNEGPRTYSLPEDRNVGAASWKQDGTVNPEILIPADDSTNTCALKGFSVSHLDSLFGTNSTLAASSIRVSNTKVQAVKPIEEVEPRAEDSDPTPVTPAGKGGSRRGTFIVLGSVALLAFRKFRRSHSRTPWQKPSFL